MKNISFITVLTLSLFAAKQAYAQDQSVSVLIDSISSLMATEEIPGMFITVVSSDSVLLSTGIGYANLNSQQKVNEQTLFRIGSISKTFTALAVLKLIDDQKLSLDTPLKQIVPEVPYENEWEDTHPILLKHLLEHKAGFDDLHFNVLTAQRKTDMTALDEVLAMRNSLISRWQPGLVHSYSNPSYVILGYLIEKLSRMTYQEFIHQEVLQPLGMNNTHFISENGNYTSATFSNGHARDGVEVEEVAIVGESAGSVLSSASDMSLLLQYLLSTDRQDSLQLIAPDLIAEMPKLHGQLEEANKINTGYGLGMYDRTYGSQNLGFKGHNGGIMGFVSDYIFSKELDIGIVVSTNTEISNRKVLNLLVDHFTNGATNDITSRIAGPISNEWDGEYRLVNERNELFRIVNFPFRTMTVEAMGDSLMTQLFAGEPVYYYPATETAFMAQGEASPSLFLTRIEGELAVYDEDQLLVSTSSFGFVLLRVVLVIAIVCSLFLLVTFVLRLLVSFFITRWRNGLWLILLSALPVTLFLLSIAMLLSNSSLTDLVNLANVSVVSVSIFGMSILGPIALTLSIIIGIKTEWSGLSKWQRVFYSLSWSSSLIFVLYCFSFDWFGVTLWSY